MSWTRWVRVNGWRGCCSACRTRARTASIRGHQALGSLTGRHVVRTAPAGQRPWPRTSARSRAVTVAESWAISGESIRRGRGMLTRVFMHDASGAAGQQVRRSPRRAASRTLWVTNGTVRRRCAGPRWGPLRRVAAYRQTARAAACRRSGQVHGDEQVAGLRFACRPGDAAQLEGEFDVGAHGEPGQQRRVLEHLRRAVPAGDLDAAGGNAFQPGHHGQQRGLAAARGADQADELAGRDVQVEPVEGQDRLGSAAVGLADPCNDTAGGVRSLCRGSVAASGWSGSPASRVPTSAACLAPSTGDVGKWSAGNGSSTGSRKSSAIRAVPDRGSVAKASSSVAACATVHVSRSV